MRRILFAVTIAAALVMLGAPGEVAGQVTSWWKGEWKFRRLVTIDEKPTKLPGSDVAVVQFPTHGAMTGDGRDVRVIAANRRLMPHRVLQIGPGDLCRIAFAVDKATSQYAVYYGNPKGKRHTEAEWQPQRGLLLETRKWPGGNLNRFNRVRATMFVRATQIQGRDFVPEIFWGVNRFAPTGDECNYYIGWLVCKEAGEYQFSTTSNDASFLTINGKMVVQWPGRHGAQHDARHMRKLRLTPGLHKIEYYHVNVGRHGLAVAAWKPPSAKRIRKIPADAFAPVFTGKLGKLDERRKHRTADFRWKHDGEAFFRNIYVQRFRFRANVPQTIRPSTVQWDFGDGITAEGPDVRHIYLSTGERKVTMRFEWTGQKYTITNTVAVQRDWAAQANHRLIGLRRIFEQVVEYDWSRMSGADLKIAIQLFEKLDKTDELLNVCSTVVSSPAASEGARAEATLLAADLYVEKRNKPDAAIALLAGVARRTKDPATRTRILLRHARVLIDAVGDPKATDAAEKLFTEVRRSREALAGLGDVWRRRGDGEKARGFYQKAADIPIFKRNHTQNVVRIGVLARYVDEYVRTGAWKDARRFLTDWEWEYPLERLRGYSTLLRVKMAEKRGLPEKAAALAMETVRANPKSPYADQLLLAAADDYHKAKAEKLAIEAVEMILSDYPESHLVTAAAERLKKWKTPK